MQGLVRAALCACLTAILAACAAPSPAPAPPRELSTLEITQEPQGEAKTESPSVLPQEPWRPPAPDQNGSDWIRLKSGEWLKGKLSSMRRTRLEFDSQKLGDQSLSWSDVVELRSPRSNTVVRQDRESVGGTLWIRDDEVVIGTPEGEQHLKRADLLSIVPTGDGERSLWSGELVFGLTSRSGNTDQVTLNGQFRAQRRGAYSRLAFDYVGNYDEVEGVENANNHRASARADLFVSKRWFLTPLSVDVFSDKFQNIALRVTPGAGAGYYVLDDPGLEWTVSAGGGWRYERFESVPAGAPDHESTAAVLLGTRFDWDLTKSVDLTLGYGVEIGVPDTTAVNHNLLAKLSVDLIGDLDLDVTFQWDRVGDPQATSAGVVPERDDFRTSVGLGWEF